MCLHKYLFSIITETGKRQNSLLVFFVIVFLPHHFWASQFDRD